MSTQANYILTVFPFEDLSQEKELGIYCRSFSADLSTELSRFRQFQVISFPSYHDAASSKLFESLNTDYFIQGTFRGEKERVRINVQLYNTESRHMVWGNRMEGKLSELNQMQDNLLAAIAGALQNQVNYDLLSKIKTRPKLQFKAYEHWLYGMEELRKGSIENDLIAREHFQKAIEIYHPCM